MSDPLFIALVFNSAGVIGLVAYIGRLMATGKWVPHSAHLEVRADRDAWRESYEIEREARMRADKQAEELLELARTTNSFITSLPVAPGVDGS